MSTEENLQISGLGSNMKISEELVDEAEKLLETLQTNNEVAYAEVGAIFREKSIISTAGDSVKRSSDISDSGVWCRVFADGAAGYRYVSDPDTVSNLGSLARKRAQLLAQSATAQYDTVTAHEGSHIGWAPDERNTDTNLGIKTDTIQNKVNRFNDSDDTRLYYEDVSRDDILLTTTGGRVRTSIDRNWVDIRSSVSTGDGKRIKISQESGNTVGFKDSGNSLINCTIDKLLEQKSRMDGRKPVSKSGPKTVVLSGTVAGHLFHQLSRYLEMDMVYFGSSSVDIGDRLTPSLITMNDTIEPGNWAAIGFDAEGRASSSVRLLADGIVKNHLHNTVTALEENKQPKGNFIPSTNPESPPRIHTRHLDIKPGSTPIDGMLPNGEIYIRSVGTPVLDNEATRTKQSSSMPPSALYAKDIAQQTPESYSDESADQSIRFPIAEGYVLGNGETRELLTDTSLVISLDALKTISEVGINRSTIDETQEKNNSRIPFSVTSPPITLDAELTESA